MKTATATTPKAAARKPSGNGFALLESRVAERKGKNGLRFDPTIIIAIISALIPLIQNCFKPTPAALRKRLGNRVRVATGLRRETPGLTWAQAFAEADELFDLADDATDAELQMVIDDCCGQ